MMEIKNNGLKVSLSKLVVIFCACFVFVTMDMWRAWHHNQTNFQWDNMNYYAYLPAAFCNKGSFEFKNEAVAYLQVLPDSTHISTKTYGVSFFQLPAFCVGNIYCSIVNKVHDGFGTPYGKSIHWGGIIYGILGLFFLRKFLLRFFSETVTAFTILICFLGTNIFYYSAGASEMDHVYLFFLISVFLNVNFKWHQGPTKGASWLLGILLGFISLIRGTETFMLLFFLLWGVNNIASLKEQIAKFKKYKLEFIIVIISFILIWIPQLIIWKILTGSFIFHARSDEHYFWTDPQIVNILFSFRKGWLLYSPLMILAFIGFFFMRGELRKLNKLMIFVLLMFIYILSCWWEWYFGGGFGGRAFSQDIAWLSLPIASLCQFLFERAKQGGRNALVTVAFTLMVFFGISLNLGQTYQFVQGYIHFDSNSRKAYEYTFGRYAFNETERTQMWEMLDYIDYKKMKSGEQRDQ